jgi:hypothetical protein
MHINQQQIVRKHGVLMALMVQETEGVILLNFIPAKFPPKQLDSRHMSPKTSKIK